jgi:NAD(P)-dependent dehydrogenase (short-subunit alcohol dehydrogenase family)
MSRTYVITGAASGIGKATADLVRERGGRVIEVDLRVGDVTVDLSTETGRLELVDQVDRLASGRIDAIVAVAGLVAPVPATVAVNYFGMVATLEGLRPLLGGSDAPRAVGVASMASITEPIDSPLVELALAGDEAGALARAAELADPGTAAGQGEMAGAIYRSSKAAFARWIRRTAAGPSWAGAGIPLNAIAPGLVITPMIESLVETPAKREAMTDAIPMPLNGPAEPVVPARLLAWLTSEENTHLTGQVVFIDGGSDVVLRSDSTW